jgi:hypothetical protein
MLDLVVTGADVQRRLALGRSYMQVRTCVGDELADIHDDRVVQRGDAGGVRGVGIDVESQEQSNQRRGTRRSDTSGLPCVRCSSRR